MRTRGPRSAGGCGPQCGGGCLRAVRYDLWLARCLRVRDGSAGIPARTGGTSNSMVTRTAVSVPFASCRNPRRGGAGRDARTTVLVAEGRLVRGSCTSDGCRPAGGWSWPWRSRSGLEAPTTSFTHSARGGSLAARCGLAVWWGLSPSCSVRPVVGLRLRDVSGSGMVVRASLPAPVALQTRWSPGRLSPFPLRRAGTRGAAVRAGMPARPSWSRKGGWGWPWWRRSGLEAPTTVFSRSAGGGSLAVGSDADREETVLTLAGSRPRLLVGRPSVGAGSPNHRASSLVGGAGRGGIGRGWKPQPPFSAGRKEAGRSQCGSMLTERRLFYACRL